MLLAGIHYEDLSPEDQIDVAYAVLIEPHTHGPWEPLEASMRAWDEVLADVLPDRESFGTDPASQAKAARAEQVFPQAAPRKPKPSTVAAE